MTAAVFHFPRGEYSAKAINNCLSYAQQSTYYSLEANSFLRKQIGNVLLATKDQQDLAAARLILDIIKKYPGAGGDLGKKFFIKLLKFNPTQRNSSLTMLLDIVKSDLGEVFFKCASTQNNEYYRQEILIEILTKFQQIIPHLPQPCPVFTDFHPYDQRGKEALDAFLRDPTDLRILDSDLFEDDSEIIAKIADVIRATLIANKTREIPLLIEKINTLVNDRGGQIAEIKDLWGKPTSLGYFGIHIKIHMPLPGNPDQITRYVLGEIQIHLHDIMDGSENCPKEESHGLYKPPEGAAGNETPKEVVEASNLIYLAGLNKVEKSENGEQPPSPDAVFVEVLKDLAPENAEKILSHMTKIQFLKDSGHGASKWNGQWKAVVPENGEAVIKELRDRALAAKKWERLTFETRDRDRKPARCENTAKSVRALVEDATLLKTCFEKICKEAADSQPECSVTYGPSGTCIKTVESLRGKVVKDRTAMRAAAA